MAAMSGLGIASSTPLSTQDANHRLQVRPKILRRVPDARARPSVPGAAALRCSGAQGWVACPCSDLRPPARVLLRPTASSVDAPPRPASTAGRWWHNDRARRSARPASEHGHDTVAAWGADAAGAGCTVVGAACMWAKSLSAKVVWRRASSRCAARWQRHCLRPHNTISGRHHSAAQFDGLQCFIWS